MRMVVWVMIIRIICVTGEEKGRDREVPDRKLRPKPKGGQKDLSVWSASVRQEMFRTGSQS